MDQYSDEMFSCTLNGVGYATAIGQTMAYFEQNQRVIDTFSLASRFGIQVDSARGRLYNLRKALWGMLGLVLIIKDDRARLLVATDALIEEQSFSNAIMALHKKAEKTRMYHDGAINTNQITGSYNFLLGEAQTLIALIAGERAQEVNDAIENLKNSMEEPPLYRGNPEGEEGQEDQQEVV